MALMICNSMKERAAVAGELFVADAVKVEEVGCGEEYKTSFPAMAVCHPLTAWC